MHERINCMVNPAFGCQTSINLYVCTTKADHTMQCTCWLTVNIKRVAIYYSQVAPSCDYTWYWACIYL